MDDVKTRGVSLLWDKPGGCPDFGLGGIRHGGGSPGSCAELGNPDAKGEVQVGSPHEDERTEAGHRGGAVRSRDEGSVMGLRGCLIRPDPNLQGEEPGGDGQAV
jgi:hypothetical protein